MSAQNYIFEGSEDERELKRLRALEAVFDPASKKQLLSTGLTSGWRCLEIGAGAGSIAKWMGQVSGESGEVVALDINARFLKDVVAPNLKVMQADIREADFPKEHFDLIHARYVFIHLPDYEAVLQRTLKALKPAGWLVLEDPDFSTARAVSGDEKDLASVEKVNRAILSLYESLGVHEASGFKFAPALKYLGLKLENLECEPHLACGGSGVAQLMGLSAEALREKYMATHEVSSEDIDRYCRFSENPDAWAVYYSSIRILAQKS